MQVETVQCSRLLVVLFMGNHVDVAIRCRAGAPTRDDSTATVRSTDKHAIRPFRIRIARDALDDLRRPLPRTLIPRNKV